MKNVRLLLVSRQEGLLPLLPVWLRERARWNATVEHAGTMQEALQVVGRKSFEAVLLDLDLPDTLGADGVRLLRGAAPGSAIVAIAPADHEDMLPLLLESGAQFALRADELSVSSLTPAILYAIERKRAERTGEARDRRLRRLELNQIAILRAVPAALCSLHHDWSVAWCNEPMTAVFRQAGGPGRSFRELFPSLEDFRNYTSTVLNGLTTTSDRSQGHRLLVRMSSGATRVFETLLVRTDPAASGAGYLVTLTDVTSNQRVSTHLESLMRLAQRLSGPLTLGQIGQVLAEESRLLFRHDAFLFNLYDQAQNTMQRVWLEDRFSDDEAPEAMPVEAEIVKLEERPLFASGRPSLFNRPDESTPAGSGSGSGTGTGTPIPPGMLAPVGVVERKSRSLMFAPVAWENQVMAVISVQSYTPYRYSEPELELLTAFASVCSGALARVRAEERLRSKETLFRSIVEDQTDVIVRVTPVGRIAYANPAFASIVRMDPAWLENEDFFQYVPSVEHHRVREHHASLRADEPVAAIEHSLMDVRGHVFRMQWTDRALFEESGGVLVYQKVGRDITKLRHAESALRRSERRLELVVHQIPALLWTTDQELRFTSVLGSGPGTRGGSNVHQPEEMVGLQLREVMRRAERDAPIMATHLAALSGEGGNCTIEWAGYHYEVRIEPLRDGDGEVVGTVGIALDVTERLRVMDQQRVLQEELHASEKLAAIGRAMASIGHCMKNMVIGLKGVVYFLEQLTAGEACHDPLLVNARDVLRRTTSRISLLLLNMLDISRDRIPRFTEVCVRDLVDEVAAVLKAASSGPERPEEHCITIEATVDPAVGTLRLDSDRLYRGLLNLGLNALDAMPGGGHLSMAVRMAPAEEIEELTAVASAAGSTATPLVQTKVLAEEARPQHLRIDVTDNGVGIQPENLNRLFEPFFSTKSSRGTGLGLTATRQFVEEHGGQLFVRSKVGVGTTFTMFLPPLSPDAGTLEPSQDATSME